MEPGEGLIEALNAGVETADGTYKADVPGIEGRDVRVVVREGKHRMVRRYGIEYWFVCDRIYYARRTMRHRLHETQETCPCV